MFILSKHQDAYGHFHLDPCSAVGQVELCLRSRLRFRVGCHQIGMTKIPSVPQQVTIEVSYKGKKKNFVKGKTYPVEICGTMMTC